jgi:peroxiredoxin
MKKTLLAFAALAAFAVTTPALAALSVGAKAPDFSAQAALAGKSFNFNLDSALKKGPVVLYFFPAAFTKGCTVEAHDFADATDDYKKLGATVIGVTAGNIDRLAEFSTSECRSKFPVAADADLSIAKSYDSTLAIFPGHSNRTSYVIAPDHKVIFAYSDLDPSKHVDLTMDALKKWRADHPN